jgi:superfamily II DNA/RNA helicase
LRFTEFDFHPDLLEGIEASNYETATPVQEQVIPHILAGKDIIASAQTGTGKTAAFLLPLIHRLLTHRIEGQVGALIIVPTRELAIQISQHLEGLSYFTQISSIAVYGGNDGGNFVAEKKALQTGTDIVVCTPGRMIAHLNMGYVQFKQLQFLVLDEADRMLDMGFQDDINKIINSLPAKRQTLLFSATMPEKIRQLAQRTLHDPIHINIAISKPPEKIVQKAFVIYDTQKLLLLKHIILNTPYKRALIFCSSKLSVKDPARFAFAHGGKDGHPFPVPIKVYDETIETLQKAVYKAKIGQSDKLQAIKKLTELAQKAEKDFVPNNNLEQLIEKERDESWQYDGRTVFGKAQPPAMAGFLSRLKFSLLTITPFTTYLCLFDLP